MSWDDAENETKGAGAGGDFLKLGDGDQATIALVGEPVVYLAKPFEGRDGAQPTKKVLLSVLNLGTKTLQVWDMAGATFQGLLEVTGSPTKPGKFPSSAWTYTVKRKGLNQKTRYTVLPDKQLSDAQKKYLNGLVAPDLEELAAKIEYHEGEAPAARGHSPAPAAAHAPATQIADEDLPF